MEDRDLHKPTLTRRTTLVGKRGTVLRLPNRQSAGITRQFIDQNVLYHAANDANGYHH